MNQTTMHMYVIKDTVAKMNGPIFTAVNDAVAQRSFMNAISNMQENGQNPDDYTLIHVGEYNIETLAVQEQTYVVCEGTNIDYSIREPFPQKDKEEEKFDEIQ